MVILTDIQSSSVLVGSYVTLSWMLCWTISYNVTIIQRIMSIIKLPICSPIGPYQPADDMMLMFYSYYKQAMLGPCNIPRPTGYWDTAGKAKW
uniref:ACB domain-containing protein n=1 Tax=Oncorhynchus tshawytscha TaxID=74940 RepID=A0AAZ3Q069_ONCTS